MLSVIIHLGLSLGIELWDASLGRRKQEKDRER